MRIQKKPALNAPDVVERLVEENLALAQFFANRQMDMDHAEAFSAAMEGLHRAAELFEPARGKFGSHAAIWIKQKIGVVRKTRKVLKRGGGSVNVWLDTPREDGRSLSDVIADEQARTGWEVMAEGNDEQLLMRALGALPETEAKIIARRFALHGGEKETLEEIAAGSGVTRERIRQIESRALERLRTAITQSEAGASVSMAQSHKPVPRRHGCRDNKSPRKRRLEMEMRMAA